MNENTRRIALLAAAIAVAATLGTLLLPPSVADQTPSPAFDPSMPMGPMGPMAPQAAGGLQITSVKSGAWSDPGSWDKGVPTAGADVLIAAGTTITYDQPSSPVLGNVVVDGALTFSATSSTGLTFTNMTISSGGLLQAGTTIDPVPASITTTLTMAPPTEGGSTIMVMGDLELHGSPVTPTWTRLSSTVQSGATTLTLADQVNWKAGDHIVVASTSLNPQESEEDWVTSVSGNTVTLQSPLRFEHDGVAPTQAEVEDLTRNVVVTSATTQIHGAGVMFMAMAKGGLSFAEFSHLGGQGVLGRYPIHFHHVQDTMVGTVVNGVSVWDSHNRFLTIHNTDGITVENSVGYRSIGHGFFMEDGTEENNTLVHNLAILTLPGKIRPDDGAAAGFWIQNPENNITDNVAVSSAGSGFDLSIPESAPQVIPFNEANFLGSVNQATTPRMLRISAFAGNEAHSNRADGIHLYRLNPVKNAPDSWFKGMTMWRNDRIGAEITGSQFNVTSSMLFGNEMGNMRIEANVATITQSQFLGEVASATVPNRIMVAPFGIEVTGGMVTVSDSTFKGHLPRGTMASADIVNAPMQEQPEAISLVGDSLLSPTQIIFGYPLNGFSYFNVIGLDGDATQSFSLVRYDLATTASSSTVPLPSAFTQFLASCSSSSNFMALKCPVITASLIKSLHG